MIPRKNPQEEDLNDLSIYRDPYEAAIDPEVRPTLECIACDAHGAVHLPRYGDGIFSHLSCRMEHHLKNFNKIFHGIIPTVNTDRVKKTSDQRMAADGFVRTVDCSPSR